MTTYTNNSGKSEGVSKWEAPSNIALTKYWGKHAVQLPRNPSISFTLSQCKTSTQVRWQIKKSNSKSLDFKFLFEGVEEASFSERIGRHLTSLMETEMPFLADISLQIESENTFPHSSGIASSASAMAALALCLCEIECEYLGTDKEGFTKRASHIARLGSGSAARSVIPVLALWGELEAIDKSSNEFAIAINDYHNVFKDYCDSVLIISSGKKEVSSTVGHSLMNNHPMSDVRYKNAINNSKKLIDILKKGDLNAFGEVVEAEALELHSLMMTSTPSFILMKPNTLKVIELVRSFREETNIPLYFTLDAGPNVHLLYPKNVKTDVVKFINDELINLTENKTVIHDEVGLGGVKINE